jgi:type II secretory pathway pseudopilin PulG
MAMSSRKTFWLIVAVLVLILGQVAVLGFIVSRFVRGRAVAQEAQARAMQQQEMAQLRNPQNFPPPQARPLQPQNRKTVTTNYKPQPKVKPTGPRAEPPQFSRAGGLFTNEVVVELNSKSEKAVIRYTLDGSEPSENSPAYSAPVPLRNTALLRAACFEPGLAPSMSVSHTFTAVEADMAGFTSDLPLVVINMHQQSIRSVAFAPCSVRIIPTVNGRASLFGEADFDGRGEVKQRGYTSLRFPKSSLTLKTRDDDGDKVKAPLLGMPSDSDWVLYAPYVDKTLLRDVLGYELSNQMGRYAPRTRFVEVFLRRSSGPLSYRFDYQGVYVLVEKIKRGKERVNIEKLTTNDLTEPNIAGGYILKRDHGASGGGRGGSAPRQSNDGVGFVTPHGLHLFHVEPEESEMPAAQRQWIARYFADFERALYGPKFADPNLGYAKYLDVDAYIDLFWHAELTKNVDAFRYSAYVHKPRGGKITVGPAWDWNLSFGNADYYDAYETSGWYYENLRDTEISWIDRLRDDPEFMQRANDRWAELRRGPFATDKMMARVDQLRGQLQESQARNFRKWNILGREIRPNYYVGETFDAEVNWMKIWLKDRAAWLDKQQMAAPKIASQTGAGITLTAGAGEIYYTLDGTDPRAPGGKVSPAAKKYTAPIKLSDGAKLFARATRRDAWSAPVKTEAPQN